MSEQPALLLFDGTCGFCAESVQFVLESREATTNAALCEPSELAGRRGARAPS